MPEHPVVPTPGRDAPQPAPGKPIPGRPTPGTAISDESVPDKATGNRRLLVLALVVALVIVGTIKGKLASMNLFMSIVEIVVVGVVSAGGGYVLGSWIPRLFGY